MKFDIGFATLYALCYGEGVSGTEEGRELEAARGEGLSLSRGGADQNHPLPSPLHPLTSIQCTSAIGSLYYICCFEPRIPGLLGSMYPILKV